MRQGGRTSHADEGRVVIDTTDPERAEAYLSAAYGGAVRTSGGTAR